MKLSFTKLLVDSLPDVWYLLLGEVERFPEGEPLTILGGSETHRHIHKPSGTT
jgi:hypothetical protein